MKAKKTKENPITFFRKANEARQNAVKKSLTKKQDGGNTDPEYAAYKAQKQAAADKKRDTEFTPGQQGKFMGSGTGKIPYDLWQIGAKSPMNQYYKNNPKKKLILKDNTILQMERVDIQKHQTQIINLATFQMMNKNIGMHMLLKKILTALYLKSFKIIYLIKKEVQ